MSGLSKPDAILFDLDDTILNDERSVEPAWRKVCADVAAQVSDLNQVELYETISRRGTWFWSDPERHRIGRTNPVEASYGIIHESLQTLGHDLPSLARSAAESYREMRSAGAQLFAGALDTLIGLDQLGLRLGLITNGNGPAQRAKIDRFGLAKLFHHVLIEGEFGCGKPDPRVYWTSMNALGCRPSNTWMVGDNLEWEVAAPQQLGLTAIWVDPSGHGLPLGTSIRPSSIIRSVTEVLPLARSAMRHK